MFKRSKKVPSNSNIKNKNIANLITVPGAIFNEVNKGAPADRPGKGSTIRSNPVCNTLFDYQNKFDLASCEGRDVVIVSHNKRLQKLIGEMFPEFAASKDSTCPYGIANCAVLEITKNIPGKSAYKNNKFNAVMNVKTNENMNRLRTQLKEKEEVQKMGLANKQADEKPMYQLGVLFDGFPDKTICQLETVVPNRSYNGDKEEHWISTRVKRYEGGGDQYAYLTRGKHNFKIDIDRVDNSGIFHSIFENGANKIILVRHGNGPHNKPCANKLFENPPLTAIGVYQAYIAGTEMGKIKILNVDDKSSFKIFTSQLKRAQQTTLQFLAALLDADTSAATTGTRENKNIRGINNNSFTFSRQDFRKACEECLKRFNADTKQIDKTGFSSKVSRKSCSFQKLLNDPKFFDSKFMQTHASEYNESDFVGFVVKYDLANPKLMRYNELNKIPSKTTFNNAVSVADSGIGSNTVSLASNRSSLASNRSSLASTTSSLASNRSSSIPSMGPVSGTGMNSHKLTNAEANNMFTGIVGNAGVYNNYYGEVGGKKTRRRSKAKKTVKKGKGKKMVTKKRMGKKRVTKKRVTKKRH